MRCMLWPKSRVEHEHGDGLGRRAVREKVFERWTESREPMAPGNSYKLLVAIENESVVVPIPARIVAVNFEDFRNEAPAGTARKRRPRRGKRLSRGGRGGAAG